MPRRERGEILSGMERSVITGPGFGRCSDNRGPRSDSGLSFRLQLHLSALQFDGILDRMAAILFADLVGLFPHETVEGIEISRDRFPRLLLGRDQGVVEPLHLLAIRLRIAALHREGARLLRS